MISICRKIEKNRELVFSVIPLHGCDSVLMLYGTGKAKAIALLKKHPLKFLGDSTADIEDVKIEGKSLIAQCYGMKNTSSSKIR